LRDCSQQGCKNRVYACLLQRFVAKKCLAPIK
jgi:hypothetical protein